jgi:hypothetical protein
MFEEPDSDRVHAGAVTFLIDGHEEEAACVLLSCFLDVDSHYEYTAIDEKRFDGFQVELSVPRASLEIMNNPDHFSTIAIKEAIGAALNDPYYFFEVRLLLPKLDPGWQAHMLKDLQEGKALNQGNPINNSPTYSWNNLRFRSNSEIKIAETLDKTGILFFPNCMARLGPVGERKNKEADFLICYQGKWGILEVDGEAYHSTAAKDHERDRFFRAYGIRVIERYTAAQCYNNPEGVIREFINIMKKNA